MITFGPYPVLVNYKLFSDEYFMSQALIEARKAAEDGEVPVGAVIVSGKKIIARAHNLSESLNDPTAHAELMAITAATGYLGSKYLDQCTLYVTLEPCAMCAAALNWAQLGILNYATRDPDRGYSKYNPPLLHPVTKVFSGILAGESKSLLQEFFRKLRQ